MAGILIGAYMRPEERIDFYEWLNERLIKIDAEPQNYGENERSIVTSIIAGMKIVPDSQSSR